MEWYDNKLETPVPGSHEEDVVGSEKLIFDIVAMRLILCLERLMGKGSSAYKNPRCLQSFRLTHLLEYRRRPE